MPKINVTEELLDLAGKPIFGPPGEPLEPGGPAIPPQKMTVRTACIQALMSAEKTDTGQQKFDNFLLAQKIQEEDEPFFKSEEIPKIKAAVGKLFIPVIVGRLWNILDQSKDKDKPSGDEGEPESRPKKTRPKKKR